MKEYLLQDCNFAAFHHIDFFGCPSKGYKLSRMIMKTTKVRIGNSV